MKPEQEFQRILIAIVGYQIGSRITPETERGFLANDDQSCMAIESSVVAIQRITYRVDRKEFSGELRLLVNTIIREVNSFQAALHARKVYDNLTSSRKTLLDSFRRLRASGRELVCEIDPASVAGYDFAFGTG